jgi:hypothetical protein
VACSPEGSATALLAFLTISTCGLRRHVGSHPTRRFGRGVLRLRCSNSESTRAFRLRAAGGAGVGSHGATNGYPISVAAQRWMRHRDTTPHDKDWFRCNSLMRLPFQASQISSILRCFITSHTGVTLRRVLPRPRVGN